MAQFVPAMDAFLSRCQLRSFHIFIVEQSNDGRKFNRGKLLNIGFDLAKTDYDSFIFHDVDLIPRDDLAEWYRKPVDDRTTFHIARCWNRWVGEESRWP